MLRTVVIIVLTCLVGMASLWGQEEGPSYQPLPRGFNDVQLGMELEAVKEELKKNGYFDYRGEPDVTMLPRPNYSVIETEGVVFIKTGFFQFHEKKLYIINLTLNREQLDFHTLYTTLKKKYGPSDYLDPEQVIWENETVRMALERPLQVKYIDREVFEALKEEGEAEKTSQQLSRDRFLQEF